MIFCQIVRDAYSKHLIRLTRQDREELLAQLRIHSITLDNLHTGNHKLSVQRAVVDFAKDQLPTYFCRLYPVSGGRKLPNVNLLGLAHSGLKFIHCERDGSGSLRVLDTLGYVNEFIHLGINKILTLLFYFLNVLFTIIFTIFSFVSFDGIADITAPKQSTLQILLRTGSWVTLYTPKVSKCHLVIMTLLNIRIFFLFLSLVYSGESNSRSVGKVYNGVIQI